MNLIVRYYFLEHFLTNKRVFAYNNKINVKNTSSIDYSISDKLHLN